jgi:hypothetical protein
VVLQGVPSRFSPEVVRLAELANKADTNDFREGRCFVSSNFSFADFDKRRCLNPVAGKPNVLIMGDSHAAHLWSGFSQVYPNVAFLQATASGCKPVLPPDLRGARRCTDLMTYMFNEYLPTAGVDAVILSGNWDKEDIAGVSRDIAWFRHHHIAVILSGPIIRYHATLPEVLARAAQHGRPDLIVHARDPKIADLDSEFASLAGTGAVPYFSAYKALCSDQTCRVSDDAGLPVQFDYGHLTHEGSVIVARHFPVAMLRPRQPPQLAGAVQANPALPHRRN